MNLDRINELKLHYNMSIDMINHILENSSNELSEEDSTKLKISFEILKDTVSSLNELIELKSNEDK